MGQIRQEILSLSLSPVRVYLSHLLLTRTIVHIDSTHSISLSSYPEYYYTVICLDAFSLSPSLSLYSLICIEIGGCSSCFTQIFCVECLISKTYSKIEHGNSDCNPAVCCFTMGLCRRAVVLQLLETRIRALNNYNKDITVSSRPILCTSCMSLYSSHRHAHSHKSICVTRRVRGAPAVVVGTVR